MNEIKYGDDTNTFPSWSCSKVFYWLTYFEILSFNEFSLRQNLTLECNLEWILLRAFGWVTSCFGHVIAILFKRTTNFRNNEWLKTFKVVVGDRLLDVPGRILQTPDIIYGQVGMPSLDLSSVINAFVMWQVMKVV